MKISKLTSYAKINLDLNIKYYDIIIKKYKLLYKIIVRLMHVKDLK